MLSFRKAAAICVAVIGIAASGCAPRMVTTISVSDDNVKLVYNRDNLIGASTGIVQCKADDEGNLLDCTDLEICFWHERKEKCHRHK